MNWSGERVINLLGNRPNWHSIGTEFLTEKILMELHQSIYVISSCQVHKIHHSFQVCLIKLFLLGLHTRPHHSQPDPIYSLCFETNHLLLREFSIVVRWVFLHHINTVEDSLSAILVIDFVVLYGQVGFPCSYGKIQQEND